MTIVSTTSSENARKKRPIVIRSSSEIARKIVAFQELISLNQTKITARGAAALLEIPNSTMQSWCTQKDGDQVCSELLEFVSKPAGQEFIQRIMTSAYFVIHFEKGGIRSVQKFLELSKLDKFVASSEGALHAYSVRCEDHIVAFGDYEEKQLAKKAVGRKITAGLDEMFRGRHPCLVAIEVVSGYILLEKFTEDRTAETWTKELKPRLEELNVELDQVVSDLCGGIRACTKKMGATHIPELFHAQYEISKATAAALSSQERAFAKNLNESEEKLKKVVTKYGEDSAQAEKAKGIRNLCQLAAESTKERSNKVKVAKKELGMIHHPINLQTGELQTAEAVKERFHNQLTIIEKCADEADLSKSCKQRLGKVRRAFNAIMGYMHYFLIWYVAFVNGLQLNLEQKELFERVVFPLSYLKMIWRRLPKKQREELQPLKERLAKELQNAPHSESEKAALMLKGKECAEKFQRSSSCVEGRNGILSLYHHRFCRLNERSVRALTAVHNFHGKRSDGNTAAERFFGNSHANLFESLVINVRIPGKPKKQYHDLEKRHLGWEQRRMNEGKRLTA